MRRWLLALLLLVPVLCQAADGDQLLTTGGQRIYLLIDAAAAADTGVWVDCAEFTSAFVTVVPAGTMAPATVEIDGLNDLAKPAPANNGTPMAAALTANGNLTISVLPRWIKARVIGIPGTSTITVTVILRSGLIA